MDDVMSAETVAAAREGFTKTSVAYQEALTEYEAALAEGGHDAVPAVMLRLDEASRAMVAAQRRLTRLIAQKLPAADVFEAALRAPDAQFDRGGEVLRRVTALLFTDAVPTTASAPAATEATTAWVTGGALTTGTAA